MEQKEMYLFLIRTAIPRVDPHNLPKGLNESNWIWDAVYRAHRDVLTGRSYVTEYSACTEQFKVGKMNRKVNTVALELYELVEKNRESGALLSSKSLLEEMQKSMKCKEIPFGQLQKLVNMTLKYLVILQTFDQIDLVVDTGACDCPIDSIIINKLGLEEKYRWTRLKKSEYNELQICVQNKVPTESKLKYDFAVWQDSEKR